ncbi:Cna B-type domain-containing protein [Peptostreptococcus stomatis]
MKKFLNIFLVFAMIFSMIFQYSGRASAAEYPNNVITGANITDLSNQPITGNNIGAWRPFRVNATYSLPNNAVHNGDKTILTLPVGFAPAAPFTFDVKAGDEVVAKGKLIDGSPVKLELTYTNYVDTHSGVSGTFFFNLQINSHTQPNTGNIPVTLTAQDGHVTNAGTVPFNPPTVAPQHLLKGGWMDSKDKSIGHYKISINQENKAMVGATLVDELKSPGVKYDKGSFTVSEVKWVVNPTQTDIIATEEVDVTSQFQSKMNIEDTRFTIAIGSRQAGKGLLVRYKTKISYEPVVGEEFKNSVELADNGQVTNRDLTYKILGAGGSSAGYVYKIKVNKTNENGGPLAGAKFSVVRDRNDIEAGTITTGPDGKGELGNLVKDKYRLVEVTAPQGYKKLTEPTIVEESDFSETDRTASKTITNVLETVDVTVTKAWVGPAKDSATVELKKEGENNALQTYDLKPGENWTHKFTNLRKYEPNGTLIKYTVKEKNIPQGYTSVVTGSVENGFTITNTNNEKVNVSVTKAWVGPAKASAKVELRKEGSNNALQTQELNAAGSWKHTFTGLDKYENNGTPIKYTVVEKDVPQGYTASVSGTMASGFTITNTNTEKVNVSVEKKWIGSLKGSVVAQLKKEGSATVIQEKELNAAGLWKHTFTGLAKYEANGTLIKYEVVEKTVPQGYVVSYEKDPAGVLIIKNKQTKIDVKVTKKWKNVTGNNPKIKVQLLKNGQNEGAPIELPNGTTTHTWTNLDKANPQGNDYVYSVKEVGETANAIQLEGDQYKVTYEGNMKDGLTITNEKKPYNPGGGGGGGTPTPDPGVIGGGDRIETAIKISRRFYDKAKTVIVVRHDLFPDSMTASVLAKLKDAPILLNPTDKLDPRVGAEIKRLGAEEVIIVGGPDSVSERVREELKVYDKDKNVERVAGVDRYGTSEMVARRVTGITGKKYTGVVASGQVFPDALSVGTFASREAYPILLVKKDTVPYQIERAIKDLDISKTYIAGGTSTIFKSTETKLPGVLERMAGKDRYETSVAIAKSKFKDSKEAFIASGEEFADALVISPISGKYNKPTLLASRNKNTNAVVKKYIQDAGLTSIIAIGGEKYLPYSVLLNLVGK